jgi:hypothetical protein
MAGPTKRSVIEVSPPLCDCGNPLTTRDELNRRIDHGMDVCDPCMDRAEETECWCIDGWFINGDPRQFEPDAENQPTEIAAWRAACEAWERGEMVNPAVEEHGPWVEPGTGRVTLGERPSSDSIGQCSAPRAYGLGAIYCDQHKQPLDAWKGWPRQHDDAGRAALAAERGTEAKG